jgi:hypothetical protein
VTTRDFPGMTNAAQKSELSPEQIQNALKLESIFMPHARKQRDEIYKKQTGFETGVSREPIRFVHYTSAEAALGIITSKRIWMRSWRVESETGLGSTFSGGLDRSARMPVAVLRRRGSRRTVGTPLRGLSRPMISQ